MILPQDHLLQKVFSQLGFLLLLFETTWVVFNIVVAIIILNVFCL